MQIAYVGHFNPSDRDHHPTEFWIARALREAGQTIHPLNVQVLRPEGVLAGLRALPLVDLVILTKLLHYPIEWFDQVRAAVSCPIIMWHFDWMLDLGRREKFLERARKVDLVIDTTSVPWEDHGIRRHARIAQACEPVEGIDLSLLPIQRAVAIVGSLYYQRRQDLVGWLRSKFHTEVFGPTTGNPVYRQALADVCRSSAVVVADNFTNTCPGYWSSRTYLIPGYRGLLVTPEVPRLAEHYRPGLHCLTYRTFEDLGQTIRAVLRDPSWARKIRDSGFGCTHTHHTWDVRAREFLGVVRQYRLA